MMTVKPSVPAVLDLFRHYHDRYPVWGSLHIVLSDQNVAHDHVIAAREWALQRQDPEGARLASILQAMSITQRLKISNLA